MSSGTGTSTFVIRWINFLTMLLAVAVIGFGVWMGAHHDNCRKSLTLPVIGLGAVILVVSIIGFLGALKNNSILLWIYLILLCIILVAILVFTVLAFIVTNNGSGHNVSGLRYKEYQLQDYSTWFLKQLNNSHNWDHLKSCLVKSDDCNNLSKRYRTLKQFKSAKLSPIEAGCCRPPSECGYPAMNASFYDLSFHPISSNKDCRLYKNSKAVKCYNCDSCKAGVAQYMKTEWRVVAIFNCILFVVLSMIYFVGCCARRNAARGNSKV
ncbi:tetraspanin-10 isoform X2 [Sesamum indicum]|uniref:Tetraspanin-10 isoform X2 n=1 Tax=Sesamum indicum TaxID=4182 RepID=A0A6I9SXH9_SESIN|nr:tetraspanin-10 isoform X2 [Sesamum indicum]